MQVLRGFLELFPLEEGMPYRIETHEIPPREGHEVLRAKGLRIVSTPVQHGAPNVALRVEWDLPRERGNAKEAGRNTLSVSVSSSWECTQCWYRAFRSMFFFIAVVCPCAAYGYLPIFLRGPFRAACIRTTCCVVNMNMASSST